MSKENGAADAQPITVSHLFGEMTWVMTRSPLHKLLPLEQLESLVMPPILLRQLYVFREGSQPIGFATWAFCSAASAKKLKRGILDPEAAFQADDWKSGDECWLVDLVAPFANSENKQREIMLADLVSGPLKGKEIMVMRTDARSGDRAVETIAADAGEALKAAILAAVPEAKH